MNTRHISSTRSAVHSIASLHHGCMSNIVAWKTMAIRKIVLYITNDNFISGKLPFVCTVVLCATLVPLGMGTLLTATS